MAAGRADRIVLDVLEWREDSGWQRGGVPQVPAGTECNLLGRLPMEQ